MCAFAHGMHALPVTITACIADGHQVLTLLPRAWRLRLQVLQPGAGLTWRTVGRCQACPRPQHQPWMAEKTHSGAHSTGTSGPVSHACV